MQNKEKQKKPRQRLERESKYAIEIFLRWIPNVHMSYESVRNTKYMSGLFVYFF